MGGWQTHTGMALGFPVDNVDTDQLIPARFMSVPRAQGYGEYLLHDLRRDAEGTLNPTFPLNRHLNISILVTGRNFGSGSSREAAVYALVDAGIRVVIAPSFGDIFSANAVNNGLLPARVSAQDLTDLMEALGDATLPMTITLKTGLIEVGERCIPFQLDETWRTKLTKGWDDVDLTLQLGAEIESYRKQRMQTAPWAWLKAGPDA